MRINLIYARARNGVIGSNNTLPWHLPEDLAHFKRCTLGCPVIMGRKTWDSLPPRFRPLPGRVNVVLTRNENWHENGVQRFSDMESALGFLRNYDDVWVIGGAEVYRQALPLAHRVVVTEIDADYGGDAFAPVLGPAWVEAERTSHCSATGLTYSFATYRNQSKRDI
ncbi:MAG TPA: dihydrofolate reductase [Burkholderiaceae bacterium]|nr:dihydrofolate reductase [Burkholderiaceae bacterium]